MLASRTKSELEKTAESIKKQFSVKISSYRTDIRSENEVASLIQKTIAEFGKIDILVNNAGIASRTLLWETPEEEWDEMIDVNLKGTFNWCKAGVPHMIRAKNGKIFNMSALAGVSGLPPAMRNTVLPRQVSLA